MEICVGDFVMLKNGEIDKVQSIHEVEWWDSHQDYPFTIRLSKDRGFCGCYDKEGNNLWCRGDREFGLNIDRVFKFNLKRYLDW